MKLDAYVNQVLVGTLEQVEVNRFVLAYQANVTSNQAVSLLVSQLRFDGDPDPTM